MATNLIQQFHQNAKAHFEIDYADKASVRNGNKAAKNLYLIAEELKKIGNTNLLFELLEVRENKTDLWAAHIFLERLAAEGETADKALNVIKRYAKSDDMNAYGERLWLEQWQKSRK